MYNYIKSELYRLSHKKSSYIYFFTIFFLFSLLMLISGGTDLTGFVEGIYIIVQGMLVFFFGIQVYISVFMDEISSKSITGIISSGLSRTKLILSKFIVSIIYLVFIYLISAIYYLILATIFNGGINSVLFETSKILLPYVGFSFMQIMTFLSIGSVLAYYTQKSTLSTTMFVLLITGLTAQILALIGLALPLFNDLIPYLPSVAYMNLVNEFTATNIVNWTKVLNLVIFFIGGIGLSTVIFSKVELKGE